MRYSAPILLVCLVLALTGCQGTRTVSGTAPSDGFPAPDKEFVWDVAARALQEQGMQPDSESSSMKTWTIQTHWRFSPQPFSSQGFRQQAVVKIHDVPGKPGYFYTETQVKRQVNDNIKEPSRLTMAKWGDESRCAELEGLINRRIEMYFLPNEYSEDFCNRYGVQQNTRRIGCDEIDRTPVKPQPQRAGPQPYGTTQGGDGLDNLRGGDQQSRNPSYYNR